jgi:hypothetical protein
MLPIKSLSFKERTQAAGLHLLLSALVAACATGLVFGVWYPGVLADLSGVWSVFLLLLAVDVCLGPLVTFIVFNRAKKELRRDLLLVVAVQLLALAYGMHTVFVGRPAYLAFNAGQFDLVYATDISPDSLSDAAGTRYQYLPAWGPKYVGAPMPKDTQLAAQIVANAVMGKDDIQYLPKYYTPLDEVRSALLQSIRDLDTLLESNPQNSGEIQALLEKYKSGSKSEVGYVPLKASGVSAIVLVDRSNGQVVDLLGLKPGLTRK